VGVLVRVVLVLCAGCSFTPPTAAPDDGSDSDGDSSRCFGVAPSFQFCLTEDPPDTFSVGTPTTLDTSTTTDCTALPTPPAGVTVCLRAAKTITISSTLLVTGPNPLVLLATEALTIPGIIDVSSKHGAQTGAGANATACNSGTPATVGANGGGGAGGGSFGTKGGDGARGDDGNIPNGTAGAAASLPVGLLRGGCKGGTGGNGAAGAQGGGGGDGGGAVYLLSGGAINISGKILASGAGGSEGVNSRAGAGGGGSGGMIVLFAGTTMNVATATIVATGGGGGEGADNSNPCDPGDDPDPDLPLVPALGGQGGCGAGGNGGNGAVAITEGAPGVQAGDAGGGGGGGGGVIRVLSTHQLTGATVSPPP